METCPRCDLETLVESPFGDMCHLCDGGDALPMDDDDAGWDDVQPPKRTPFIEEGDRFRVGDLPLSTGVDPPPLTGRKHVSIKELRYRAKERYVKKAEERRARKWAEERQRESELYEKIQAEREALLEGNLKVLEKAQMDHPDDFRAQFWAVTTHAYEKERHGYRCPKCDDWIDFAYRTDENTGELHHVAWICCT